MNVPALISSNVDYNAVHQIWYFFSVYAVLAFSLYYIYLSEYWHYENHDFIFQDYIVVHEYIQTWPTFHHIYFPSVLLTKWFRRNIIGRKAAFTRDATGRVTAARQPRRKIETEEYNRSVYTVTHCSQQARDCCEPGRHFKFELKITARHRLLRAFFLKNTYLRNCRYIDYMQESRATAAYLITAICRANRNVLNISKHSYWPAN